LNTNYTFSIYQSTKTLPDNWDDIAVDSVFLSKAYLQIFEEAAPKNMTCYFVGVFENMELKGIAIVQFLNLNLLSSFGDRDKCIKTFIRNFIFKNFASGILILGNNMLTGQNAFIFKPNFNLITGLNQLKLALKTIKTIENEKGNKVHLNLIKDFDIAEVTDLQKEVFNDYFNLSSQPNMVFDLHKNWKTTSNYVNDFSKKYRNQYSRAQHKMQDVSKRKLKIAEILKYEDQIYALYEHVAKNAPFNTFFLPKNHFYVLKEKLKENFLFYGYFIDDNLFGFNTLIKNGTQLETYFLGYNNILQREKMLYLNMLYDMIGYSIKHQYKKIIFARTALEIKSSVGAKPHDIYGLVKHNSFIINKFVPKIFNYVEPKTVWTRRNPFKNS
jgi:hypothetical protein